MAASSKTPLLFFTLTILTLLATGNSCYLGCTTNNHPSPPTTRFRPYGNCPRDALKFGVCAKLLNTTIGTEIGNPPDHPCCSALGGLLDLEVAACLCTALKANILGIDVDIPISLSLLVNTCGKTIPKDYICA